MKKFKPEISLFRIGNEVFYYHDNVFRVLFIL